jgi:hypothetical protein
MGKMGCGGSMPWVQTSLMPNRASVVVCLYQGSYLESVVLYLLQSNHSRSSLERLLDVE